MTKRLMLSEEDMEEIYQGEKLLYEGMRKAISFMPTMSWEEHCDFTNRFRDRIERGSFASIDEGHDKQVAQGRQGNRVKRRSTT